MPRVHEQLSENELVLLCRHGDEEAIGALYDRFGRPAFGLALAMLEFRNDDPGLLVADEELAA